MSSYCGCSGALGDPVKEKVFDLLHGSVFILSVGGDRDLFAIQKFQRHHAHDALGIYMLVLRVEINAALILAGYLHQFRDGSRLKSLRAFHSDCFLHHYRLLSNVPPLRRSCEVCG